MVKTPRTRHSKATNEPVTIDLEPDAVSRVKADEAEAAGPAEPTHHEQTAAETAAEPESVREEAPAGMASSSAFGREPHAPSSRERSGAGALGAGVAGGAIALLIAGGLHFAGLLPLGTTMPPQVDNSAQFSALETQLANLQAKISSLAGVGEDPALAGRMTAAEEKVSALDEAIETLRSQVASLSEAGGEVAAPVDLSPIEQRIAALETALADAREEAPEQGDLAAVEQALAGLREEVTATREAQAAAGARVEALEQALARVDERLSEQAELPGTAAIIAASSLKAAIDRGGPFVTELDTFAALAPDAPQVEALRVHASKGVATRVQLASEANDAANAMIAAAVPVDPDAGIVDRLWSSAVGLVQVRPIGMVEGDGVPQIAARLDAAVQAGDYERALAEYAAMPEAAKAAGSAFMERVEARHEVDRLIDEALSTSLRT